MDIDKEDEFGGLGDQDEGHREYRPPSLMTPFSLIDPAAPGMWDPSYFINRGAYGLKPGELDISCLPGVLC